MYTTCHSVMVSCFHTCSILIDLFWSLWPMAACLQGGRCACLQGGRKHACKEEGVHAWLPIACTPSSVFLQQLELGDVIPVHLCITTLTSCYIIHARRCANHAIHGRFNFQPSSTRWVSRSWFTYEQNYMHWHHQECAFDNNSITWPTSSGLQ